MKRECTAPACSRETSAWGRYCNTHKSRARRHGHPLQQAVTKGELRPYLTAVDAVVDRNTDSPLWELAGQRWDALVRHCQATVAAYWAGKPMRRWDRLAAEEIVKLAEHVDAQVVLRMVCAVYLLQERDPRRFRSDDAFRHQLVRRCRGLTDVNAGTWFDNATGRVKRAYRDLAPKAALAMGGMLAEVLGPVGTKIAQLDRDRANREWQQRKALGVALRGLR